MEDGHPTCVGERDNSSPRGCSHGPEILDLAPPMEAPMCGKAEVREPHTVKEEFGV